MQQVHHASQHHTLLCRCINIKWWMHNHIQRSRMTWLMQACGFLFFSVLIYLFLKNPPHTHTPHLHAHPLNSRQLETHGSMPGYSETDNWLRIDGQCLSKVAGYPRLSSLLVNLLFLFSFFLGWVASLRSWSGVQPLDAVQRRNNIAP